MNSELAMLKRPGCRRVRMAGDDVVGYRGKEGRTGLAVNG